MPNCDLCPRKCAINEGDVGFCGVRKCRDGKIVSVTAGLVSGFAVDPIEKKPLNHFFPGSSILSFGSVGCNLACRFCQNWESAKSRDVDRQLVAATPEEIAALVRRSGCESVAFTYNEPIICAEFVMDVARTCRLAGIRTVAVSNGFIADRWREPFFKLMDAVNIDLKSFSDTFYEKFCSGSLEPIRETIRHLAKRTDVWLEVTTLLIPTLNDSDREIESLSRWLAEEAGVETPLHFSAFRPAYQLRDLPPTPPRTLFHAREIAQSTGLRYVYTGNIDDPAGQTTYCPQCRQAVISRTRFQLDEYNIDGESCCHFCGQTIAGRFTQETE